MAATATTVDRVSEYLDRVESLYESIREWMRQEDPEVEFTERDVTLNEELAGRYRAKTLKVLRPGRPAMAFVPRGVYMVAARGRVDVLSALGSEILVWVEAGGSAVAVRESGGAGTVSSSVRSLFPRVTAGWAWVNDTKTRLEHLTREVFLQRIAGPLSE